MRNRLTILGVLAGSFIQISSAQEPKTAGSTVWDGVYTAAQAQRGNSAYLEKCSGCHKEDLSGYQSVLKGASFMQHWREDSLDGFYTTVKTSMPRGAPGTLSDAMYVDIVAYVLQANEFPAGTHELTVDALTSIKVEAKTGKGDVPPGALADVIGCLEQGSGDSWLLTRASEPVRTRNPGDSTPEQLKASAASPLGTRKFGLMDAPAYHPDSLKGYKVEAKGFTIKNPSEDRLNLTALQSTGLKCGD